RDEEPADLLGWRRRRARELQLQAGRAVGQLDLPPGPTLLGSTADGDTVPGKLVVGRVVVHGDEPPPGEPLARALGQAETRLDVQLQLALGRSVHHGSRRPGGLSRSSVGIDRPGHGNTFVTRRAGRPTCPRLAPWVVSGLEPGEAEGVHCRADET